MLLRETARGSVLVRNPLLVRKEEATVLQPRLVGLLRLAQVRPHVQKGRVRLRARALGERRRKVAREAVEAPVDGRHVRVVVRAPRLERALCGHPGSAGVERERPKRSRPAPVERERFLKRN